VASPAQSVGTEAQEPQIWLNRYLRLQRRYDIQIHKRLNEAMQDISADLAQLGTNPAATVGALQIMAAKVAISDALAAFWTAMGNLVAAGQSEAVSEALRTSFEWEEALLRLDISRAARADMKASLIDSARFNVEAMLARVYKTRVPLSIQVYRTSALALGWVDRRLDLSLAQGKTVAQVTKEVKEFVDPRTPGGATYAARRLARTEINNAYHAATVIHFEESPWVVGMRWRLSGSHPSVDLCDSYARRNHSQLGTGVFPRDAVPPKPHPQCLCVVFPVLQDAGAFLAHIRSGDYDDYIAREFGIR
jgi:hypothetical protein